MGSTPLRPHLVWGVGDLTLPRVIQRAKQGRLRIVGDGTNQVISPMQNVADAHIKPWKPSATAKHLQHTFVSRRACPNLGLA